MKPLVMMSATALLAHTATAAAQMRDSSVQSPPTRPQVPPHTERGGFEDRKEAARVLQKFAKCAVDTRPGGIAAIVDPPYGTADADRRRGFQKLSIPLGYCLGILGKARMSAAHYLYWGYFAEQLYRRHFRGLPNLGQVEVPPVVHPDQVPVLTTLRFAACLIDRDPAAVDLLVRSPAGSNAEAARFGALASFYSACLDAGSRLALNRLTLRAALAEHLYRRALAGTRRDEAQKPEAPRQ